MDNKNLFLSCDWGTTRFRLRLAEGATGRVLAEVSSQEGVARLAAEFPEAERSRRFGEALCRGVKGLAQKTSERIEDLPILISGMAGSSIGWRSLTYANLPFALDGSDMVWQDAGPVAGLNPEQRVILLSGVRSRDDVLRGEETELLGVAGLETAGAVKEGGMVVLPGTHSKHCKLANGKMVDFKTYMTGELFQVLSSHSVLKHSTSQGSEPAGLPVLAGEALAAFQEGVREVKTSALPSVLFHVRTRQVLDGKPAGLNTAFLSGVLIGAEVHDMLLHYPGDKPVVLCAGQGLAQAYAAAFAALEALPRLRQVPAGEAERLPVLGQAVVMERALGGKI